MGEDVMWLRDLLPTEAAFKKDRIMVVSYNSKLFDKDTLAQLDDLADYILKTVRMARNSTKVGSRKP
jgi:hypothetical protein